MSVANRTIDGSLRSWTESDKNYKGPESGILLGNGASLAVWERFGYRSLYEIACIGTERGALTRGDRALFDRMETKNFEAVLSALNTAKCVCHILGQDTDEVMRRYESIRSALIRAVRGVHLPFKRMPKPSMSAIFDEIKSYDYVFTTNYDLLYYWSMMQDENLFKDYFWNKGTKFDPTNTVVRSKTTMVLYLHGALHLYLDDEGKTAKRACTPQDGSILRQLEEDHENVLLFISEGTSADKMTALGRNDYLAFAYQQLLRHEGTMVIFGHSLTPGFDQHIIEALKAIEARRYHDKRRKPSDQCFRVAISIVPSTPSPKIMHEKARLKDALPYLELEFFDSTTHPLGNPELRVKDEGGEVEPDEDIPF
jgi:Domain of unknown function (DUF4917)